MKKYLLGVVCALALIAVPAQAKVRLGVKGGLNVQKASFSTDMFNSSNRAGFFVGATLDVPLVLGLGLDVSALYDQKNIATEVEDENGVIEEYSKTLNYIDVPVNLKYTIGIGSFAGIYVATGPQFAFHLGNSNIWENSYSLKNSQFSWNVGAGVKILSHLQLGYTYNIGIGKTAELNESSVLDAFKTGDMDNANSHMISLTYLF